jgi:malto-oligosyltrehalose trehalohydrolase
VLELMPIAAFPGTRNWGYDGVLPFAPAESYGPPDDLCELIIRAHELGISVILDVVYNHFGPDGNYLSLYAKEFFREDSITPWGPAFDFRKAEVRQFFSDNARYWLFEFGFDGLRFDAVHAIRDEGWLAELAGELRSEAAGRKIHLVLENEDNTAHHLRSGFDAQWNDDMHHVLHVLLTGETQGYYRDFGEKPIALLARALGEGFIYQGQPSKNREGAPRGEPSADLPPTAFVSFLQNHDQTGNRALGERLTVLTDPRALKAAIALQLLTPQIPLIFMGEEIGSRTPFLYFTDHNQDLAQAVREGRAREFAAFAQASQSRPLPDPNVLETFAASVPQTNASDALAWRLFYRDLLALRQTQITTRLDGAQALSGEPIGEKAVLARWRMGDGKVLTLASNLGPEAVNLDLPAVQPFYGHVAASLTGYSTLAWLE